MKILITGSNGQLGIELLNQINLFNKKESFEIIKPLRNDLDLSDNEKCEDFVRKISPDILINLAAYTAVEKAEYNVDYARKVNALSLKSFAKTIKEQGGHIIQISTDYVFNGEQNSPYKTSQSRKPLGIYGKTKCEGEIFLENILCNTNQFTIIRTSWLVGPWRSNFVKTILTKLKDYDDKESLKIVSDQVGCITTTESLGALILLLINKKFHNEVLPSHLHWCSDGEASWYQIALSIKKISKQLNYINSERSINPISSNEYKSSCPRPKYSVLDNKETEKIFNIKSNHWEKDLKKLIKKIKKDKIL